MTELEVRTPTGIVSASSQGSGPVLLVVHPGGQDASTWGNTADLLECDFQVVRLRRRIYDAGSVPAQPHSMRAEAADLLALTAALPGPIVAVGHSSGAVAVLEAALAPAAPFAGVVAYEPPMPVDSSVAGAAQARASAALRSGDPVEAMRIHLQDIVGLPTAMVDEMLTDGPTRATLAAVAAGQLADNAAIDGLGVGIARYAGLQIPVVLRLGELSPSHLRERSEALSETIPHARTVTMPGTGHLAHLDHPALLAATVRDAAQSLSGL